MRRRCNDPRNIGYANYGGRGIKVCARWQDSFENFLADMGVKPTSEHSVERRDNDLGYEPDNCCWLLTSRQSENRRSNVYLRVGGETVSSKEAARRVGLSYYKLRYWLRKGRSLDEIMAQVEHGRYIDVDGERVRLAEAARRLGMSPNGLSDRIRKGQDIHAPKGHAVYLTFKGETLNLKEWAKKVGIPHPTVWYRHNKGWPVERILGRPS